MSRQSAASWFQPGSAESASASGEVARAEDADRRVARINRSHRVSRSPSASPSVGMPRASQSACQATSVSSGTAGGPNSSSARPASLGERSEPPRPTIVAPRAEVLREGVGEIPDRDRLGSVTLSGEVGVVQCAQAAQRDRVGVPLPDHVDLAHRDVDRLAVAHLARDVVEHAVAQVDRIVEPVDQTGVPRVSEYQCSPLAPDAAGGVFARRRQERLVLARAARCHREERVDVAGRERDDAALRHRFRDERGQQRVRRPRARTAHRSCRTCDRPSGSRSGRAGGVKSPRGRAGRRGSARRPALEGRPRPPGR